MASQTTSSPSTAASVTVSEPFLPFALPDIGEAEIAEVVDALRSGWITTGPKTRQFEADFTAFLGGGVESMAVNSATAGLHLALEAIGVGPGDEVITTTHTFTATAEVVRYLGAHPVLVDVDLSSLCIDVAAAEAAITPRTKAIIPVHFGGRAADMQGILDLAHRHGLRVIEDAAHAIPTTYHGTKIGALASDATVFSFYANKTLATGEGGMIVTRDPDIAARCKVMRLHGISRDSFDRYRSTKPAWQYEIVAPGFKYNLTDIASALGIHQLRRVGEMHQRREEIAEQFDRALAGLPCVLPPHAEAGDVHAWHLYPIQLTKDAPVDRASFIDAMAAAGIGTSVHYIPLHRHPYWRDTYGLAPEHFPAAEAYYAGAVSLPIFSKMRDEDVERVVDGVVRILAR
jgi:dTDP-4-amino-4,6-dideoxygalactose transaminase